MKVKDLKALLDTFDENLEIFIFEQDYSVTQSDGGGGFKAEHYSAVSPLSLAITKRVLNNRIAERPSKETRGAEKSLILYPSEEY